MPPSSEFLFIASTALLLTIFGIVMVISATSATETGVMDTALKQATFAVIGIPLMFLVSRLPIAFLKKMAWPALILATLMQLLVFTPLGIDDAGNRNWIDLGFVSMQPSEFMKLALALWIAYVLLRKRALLGIWHHVFIPVIPVGVLAIGTVMAGKDLGTVMVLVLILLGCLFFAGVKLRLFILPLLLAAAGVVALAIVSPDRMRRITAVCTDMSNYAHDCYQSIHAVWGMAASSAWGSATRRRSTAGCPRRRTTSSSRSSARSSASSAALSCSRCSRSSRSARSTSCARRRTRSSASQLAVSPSGSSARRSSTSAS
jgi:cell division protein FtsW